MTPAHCPISQAASAAANWIASAVTSRLWTSREVGFAMAVAARTERMGSEKRMLDFKIEFC